MRKKLVFIATFLLTLLAGVTNNQLVAQHTTTQKEEALTPNDRNYTGPLTEQDFTKGYTEHWFKNGYKNYNPPHKIVKKIKHKIKKYTIKVFMGTWCPDSRREVPKLFKLLDKAKFDMDNLTVYAVNHRKQTEEGYEEGLHISHVPTIIFYNKKGEEVNRFVEHPIESLAEDILAIISKKEYTNYIEGRK